MGGGGGGGMAPLCPLFIATPVVGNVNITYKPITTSFLVEEWEVDKLYLNEFFLLDILS